MGAERPTEIRAVRSRDPSLSDRANDVLTEELQRVVGADAVEVPADRPHEELIAHGRHRQPMVELADNRVWLALMLLSVLVFGLILALLTGSWWFVVAAVAIDIAGCVAVATNVFAVFGESEHLSPAAAALLEDEGVEDPDALFTRLVAEFTPAGRAIEH